MKILIHKQNVSLTDAEETEVREKITDLERFLSNCEPVTVDIHFTDESAKAQKNGRDQAVHINAMIGGEQKFIEEVGLKHMQAFRQAYHRFKTVLEDYHEKKCDDKGNREE